MDYQSAKEIVQKNNHLIGKTIIGGKIDELIIYPTNESSYDDFFKSYIRTQNAEASVQPYTNEDVEIYAIIDKSRINANGIIAHSSLKKISKEHTVNY
jgi:hypothetical protein